MKNIFILPIYKKLILFTRTSAVKFLTFAFCISLLIPSLSHSQQFVKTYKSNSSCNTPAGNLIFNCITRSAKSASTFYITGMQDSSLYIGEVDAMGIVLQEKTIPLKTAVYTTKSMITDDEGNIVLVGYVNNTWPYLGFLMKFSPALSLIVHRTYDNLVLPSSYVLFTDVKDNKASGSYYICGSYTSSTGSISDALLLRVDRNTGSIINTKLGGTQQYDFYDAMVLTPTPISNLPSIIAAGSLNGASAAGYRSWINIHTSSLLFSKGARYLRDNSSTARIISASLVRDESTTTSLLLHCWYGDTTAAGDVGINTGISSVNATSLVPTWQKEYTLTPRIQNRMLFTKVATDAKGYVAEGNWWDGVTKNYAGLIGEMILLRTDKKGTPVWSRRLKNVLVNVAHHNASFVIDGSSIYAVGFMAASASSSKNTGILVRIPLLDGMMDTTCASIQTAVVKNYTFNVKDSVRNNDVRLKDSVIYNAVNCTLSQAITNCDFCDTLIQLPSADFVLTGSILSSDTTYYKVTASSFFTGPNSRWIVSEVNITTGANIAGTIYNSAANGPWGSTNPTQFGGYFGSEVVGGVGTFQTKHKYRFSHILSQTTNCGLTKNDTVTKSIFICPSCKPILGSNVKVVTENDSKSTNKILNDEVGSNDVKMIRMSPNPVSGSSFTLAYYTPTKGTVNIKIIDAHGRQLQSKQYTSLALNLNRYSIDAKQLPNGAYTIIIENNGKTSNQKFVVAK